MKSKVKLKPLNRQVMVITGATSGIGLTTARLAASRGARLLLIARNEEALRQLAEELAGKGGQVRWLAADVADEAQLRRAVELALQEFGAIDTWVNNAGVSIFGSLEEVSLEDHRRLFETNFWGVVNGSLVAVAQLRRHGGALINIGSELSDLSAPLQGMYSASKHAVKAFTDSLRMEVEKSGAPVSVTLIKPAAIDTLYVEHAKNYMEVEAQLPKPLYAPELVAEAILSAAEHPRRDIYVGATAKLMSLGARFAPRWLDRYLEQSMFQQQRSAVPEHNAAQNSLYEPGADLRERGQRQGPAHERCAYTSASLHPRRTYALLGTAVAAAVLWRLGRPERLLRDR